MSPDDLKITFPLLTNGTDSALLIGYSPAYEYNNETKKRTDKQIGIFYKLALESMGYEKISVKVLGIKPVISMEELQDKGSVRCTFKGFKAHFYKDYKKGEYQLAASAEAIVLIDEEDLLS